MRPAMTSALGISLLATLVWTCGGGPSSDSAGPRTTDPEAMARQACSLLTADDIEAVMGTAPGASRFESNQCIWPSADGSNQFLVQVILTGSIYRSYDEIAKQYREQLDTDPATAIHPIEGVGEFAVGFNDMAMVQAFTSSRMVQVSTLGHEEKHALELAKRAVARVQ